MPKLGFGIMRMPYLYKGGSENKDINYAACEKLIDTYMQGDYCYFDTHPCYMNGHSEEIIRRFVVDKYDRKLYKIADKIPAGIENSSDYEYILSNSLVNLGVGFIDYYMLHALGEEIYLNHDKFGGFDFLAKKKLDGIVGQIGFPYHLLRIYLV